MCGSGWQDLDLVCDDGTGWMIVPDVFSKAFKRLAAEAGLDPRVRLHDLRHAFATELLRARVDPVIAAHALGHSSPSFTMSTYQHVLDGMADIAANAIDAAHGSAGAS